MPKRNLADKIARNSVIFTRLERQTLSAGTKRFVVVARSDKVSALRRGETGSWAKNLMAHRSFSPRKCAAASCRAFSPGDIRVLSKNIHFSSLNLR